MGSTVSPLQNLPSNAINQDCGMSDSTTYGSQSTKDDSLESVMEVDASFEQAAHIEHIDEGVKDTSDFASQKISSKESSTDDVSEPTIDWKLFLPSVRLEKMTKTTIYGLTKHANRRQNLRSFIKQQRYNRRKSGNTQKRKQREDHNTEALKKWKSIQDFLEYNSSAKQMTKYQSEIDFFKPKRRSFIDIDRFSTDRSETSSISGSSIINESFRSLRQNLSAPVRFENEKFKARTRSVRISFDPNISFVVEKICSINLVNNEIFFWVKWENYTIKENTWEPLENVRDCEELVLEFIKDELSELEDSLEYTMKNIIVEQEDTIESYLKKPKADVMAEIDKKYDPFKFRCSQLCYMLIRYQNTAYNRFRKKFEHLVVLKHLSELEKEQNNAHNLIGNKIMEIEKNEFQIYIENDVDFSVFEPFNYTRENILPENLHSTNDETKIGCACKSCDRMSMCCPKKMLGNFAYKECKDNNRLRLLKSQMIFECNEYCKCDESCLNRITQQPRKHPLKIFKTDNGRGWGLKAVKSIPRGTYIIEYTGEIIDQEESVRRGEKYDEIGKSYLFDLDFNEKSEAVFTIDAAHHGNLSRLINHSCDPNCRIWPVAICNSNSASIYKLCYFTTRIIKADEELTIDYSGGTILSDDTSENGDDLSDDLVDTSHCHNIIQKHRTLDVCKCGSSVCKGYIFP